MLFFIIYPPLRFFVRRSSVLMEGEPQLERVWIRVCARACGGETPDTALIGITMSCRGEMRLTKPKATASHLTRSGSAGCHCRKPAIHACRWARTRASTDKALQ